MKELEISDVEILKFNNDFNLYSSKFLVTKKLAEELGGTFFYFYFYSNIYNYQIILKAYKGVNKLILKMFKKI
jgi:hypothetical protein